VITLVAPLPTIWDPLTINGYSSPGSAVNTDPSVFFNGTLCVAVTAANIANTPSAFVVPSGAHDASLTVKGLGFGAFVQSIALAGGHSHQIIGNEFGGTMNGIQLDGSYLAAVQINTSGSVIVGGSSPADHNVIQHAGSPASGGAGVLVGTPASNVDMSCQIVGNLFGITPDGFSATPNNNYGILLQGSGCVVQGNRMAGNIKDAIYISGGSNNVIQNNVIGPAMFFGQDFYNPGTGIRVDGGATNNTIGAAIGFDGNYYSNTITDMDGGGIVLGDSTGTLVRGNFVTGNGLLTGLNLDLGADGITPNDSGDIDSGANHLMNYPVPHGLAWTNGTPMSGTFNIPAEIGGLFDLAPGTYQLDAYYDHSCNPIGSGGGSWVGGAQIDVVSGGRQPFDVPIVVPNYDLANGKLSVTATLIAFGDNSTSEFSRCMALDTIFLDSFDE
jgi:parallel beta-helix repeat protein